MDVLRLENSIISTFGRINVRATSPRLESFPGASTRKTGVMTTVPQLRALDGDGWVECELGHRHWGRFGAAGLLLRTVDRCGQQHVLLQHRASWTHHGGTWGAPGGARASWETPEQAALREVGEEAVIDLAGISIERVHADDHGGWCYWTVLAGSPSAVTAAPRGLETAEMRWVLCADVVGLELHPGFAASWPLVSSPEPL
jgi:8-oxo-dGTP diphosphatase